MDTKLQKRKFDAWLVHYKCNNFNELVRRMNRGVIKKAVQFMSWSKASERCTKWMIVIIKQFKWKRPIDALLWDRCRIQNEIQINKVAYKHQEAWTEKEYFILKRLNEGIKLETEIDPLFQITSYFATSKLEFFIRDNKGVKRNKPRTWRKAKEKLYRRFLIGIAPLDELEKWIISFRRSSRNFNRSKDESKLIIQSIEQRTRRLIKNAN